jgi:hypothetical protein
MLLGEAKAGFCVARPALERASYSGVLRRRSVTFSDGWLWRVPNSFEVKMDLGLDIKLKIALGRRERWADNHAHKGIRGGMLPESDGGVKKRGRDAATRIWKVVMEVLCWSKQRF